MLDMTNDSERFHTERELIAYGAYRVSRHRWEKGDTQWLPLYEGKMVQAYDHRAASVVLNSSNVSRPAQQEAATDIEHQDPDWSPEPQFWVRANDVALDPEWTGVIGFKDITSPTNARTMIAAMIPRAPCGNTLPLLLPDRLAHAGSLGWGRSSRILGNDLPVYCDFAPLLLANLKSFVLDFVARQKIQGNHLNFYIVEQLPTVPEGACRMCRRRSSAA